MHRSHIVVIAILAWSAKVEAQVVINDTVLPKADIVKADPPPGESAQLGMNIFDIAAEVPLHANVDAKRERFTVVLAGLSLRRHSFSLDVPAGQDEYFPDALYGIDGSLAVMKSFGRKWYGVGFGAVGLHSDMENVDADHLVAEGGGFAIYKVTDNLHLGAGPVFTYAFGKPLVIPAPFLKYQGEGRISVETKFPRYAKVRYAVSDAFDVGLAARSLYNNYRLGADEAVGPDGKSTVVVFSDLTVGLEASVRIYAPLYLTLGGGTTVHRTFEVNDDSGDQLFDRGMKDTLFFSAGLEARL